jgi:hypothetical protein
MSEIVKFNALALSLAFPFTLHATTENLSRNKLHAFKPAEKAGRQKGVVLRFAHPGLAFVRSWAADLRGQ